jgi:hypothetical protein
LLGSDTPSAAGSILRVVVRSIAYPVEVTFLFGQLHSSDTILGGHGKVYGNLINEIALEDFVDYLGPSYFISMKRIPIPQNRDPRSAQPRSYAAAKFEEECPISTVQRTLAVKYLDGVNEDGRDKHCV